MKSARTLLVFIGLATLLLLNSCSISNPLSELSWGQATIIGRVTRTFTSGGNTLIEGVPGAMVNTDSGTEVTYTNQSGYYELDLTFRIGSAAKEKKIKVTAYDPDDQSKTGNVSDVYIRDGLVTQVPPITWTKF